MDWDMFFEGHKDLPREGPGSPEDVAWAVSLSGLTGALSICDAACGPGGDIAALRNAAPEAQITGVDKMASFVAQAQHTFRDDPHVTVMEGDLAELPGTPYDLIWCAGALYFLGLDVGPKMMQAALRKGGVLAFSEPVFFTDTPSEAAVAFWEGYPTQTRSGILSAVEAAGFTVLGDRPVPPEGWEAYFQPQEARIAQLRAGADARLTQMLNYCAAEAEAWRAVQHETGYLLVVAKK